MAPEQNVQTAHLRSTKALIIRITLCIIVLILSPIFLFFLSGFSLFGFPLDFYMTAQGIILILVGVVFWHAVYQARLDQTHNINEGM